MIPDFNASMVLPPFVGDNPAARAGMSPYKATILELVSWFPTSPERIAILRGLITYRKALINIGIIDGFQWIDGSYVEAVEVSRKRPPSDIDIVTFASNPHVHDTVARQKWVQENMALFDAKQTKVAYKCDAFFVDLCKRPALLVDDSRYWFGLFSHQRETSLWKGMIQIPMISDDDDGATNHLNTLESDVTEMNNA